MIVQVILWDNGMVMVLDDRDCQVPDYQGRLAQVQDRILRDAPASTGFQRGHWGSGVNQKLQQISRAEFADAT